MSVAYANPPIQEAICEFHLAEPPWSITTAGEIYHEFVDEYPGEPQTQQQQFASASAGQASFQVASRFALRDESNQRVVTVAPGALSVHAVRDYPGWPTFQRRAEDALSRYRRVRKPTALHRVAVRAVNRIVLPDGPLDLSQWFVQAPRALTANLGHPLHFIRQDTFRGPNGAWLIVNFATPQPAEAPSEQRVIVLDINAILTDGPLGWDDVSNKLMELHSLASEAFEASITDALRERFREAPT